MKPETKDAALVLKIKQTEPVGLETLNINVDWTDDNFCCGWGDEELGVIFITDKNLLCLKEKFEQAIKDHIQLCLEDGDIVPEYLINGNYQLNFILSVPAILREAERFTTMAALSKVSGINQKQLSHYANGTKKARPDKRERIINGIHEIGRQALSIV